MPYNPGIAYTGDKYTYLGLAGLGQDIAKGIVDWKQKHDELMGNLAQSDVIVDYAKQQGVVSPQQWTDYVAGNANQKTKMAEGFAKTMALNTAAQNFAAQQQIEREKMANQLAAARIAAGGHETFVAPNTGQPVHSDPADETSPIIGYRNRYGGVDALPAGTVFPKTTTRKADDLEVYTIPGSDPKNPMQVVRDKKTKEIIPNQQIQGIVRPDPMTQMFLDKFNQTPKAPENVLQTFMGLFNRGAAAPSPTPGPTAAPTAAPGQYTADQTARAQQALNDPDSTDEEIAAAKRILGQ